MLPPSASSSGKRPTMPRKRTSERTADNSSDNGSAASSADSKLKQRDRISMACIHCRHRKIKCNGEPSCATCVRLKRNCEYEAVTEIQNLLSRDRKRRNKEIKQAKIASSSAFANQASFSGVPYSSYEASISPLALHAEQAQAEFGPLFLSSPDPKHRSSDIQGEPSLRRRRGISLTHPAPSNAHGGFASSQKSVAPPLFASLAQSQTPSAKQAREYYQSLATPHPHNPTFSLSEYPSYSIASIQDLAPPDDIVSAHHNRVQQQMMESTRQLAVKPSVFQSPLERTSSSEAEYEMGLVSNLSETHTIVPTSAHVRPVDQPAPHGHFDFATLPFPSHSSFMSEMPYLSLRRRSSIHLPVGEADVIRRPSIAEAATAALMQRVSDKRAASINEDTKQLVDELLSGNLEANTGIAAWSAQVQSYNAAPGPSWMGFPSTDPASDSFDYVAMNTPAARSNSDGLLSLGPLSPSNNANASGAVQGSSTTSQSSVSSTNGDASLLADTQKIDGYFNAQISGAVMNENLPFPLTSFDPTSNPSVKQQGWAAFQNHGGPMLSPVADLNNSFNNFGMFASPTTPLATMDTFTPQHSRQYSQPHYPQHQHQSPQLHRPHSQHYDTSTLASAFGTDPERSNFM